MEPGWYWQWRTDSKAPGLVEVRLEEGWGLQEWAAGWDYGASLPEDYWWMGPLPMPEPPGEGA